VDRVAAPACREPDDLRQILDEEIDRLPSRQRTAFVLCCLEGKTGEEAARELGCRPGTISSRLTRARDRLRVRLSRRGLAPSAAVLATALAGDAVAYPSAALIDATRNVAHLLVTGKGGRALPPRVTDLARGVLNAMLTTKLRLLSLVLLLAGALAAGGVFSLRALEAAPPEETKKQDPQQGDEPSKLAGTAGPVAVWVASPLRGGLDRTTRSPCTLHAFQSVDLYPAATGTLKSVTVDIGDRVKKGQALAELDAPLLTLEEKQAVVAVQRTRNRIQEGAAQVATAKAELQAAKSGVVQRQAEIDGAKATEAFREKQLERSRKLFEARTVDRAQVEEHAKLVLTAKAQVSETLAALEAAKAVLVVKETKVDQALAALTILKCDQEAAEIGLEKARVTLGFTRIVSPVDGIVTRRNVFPGDYLQSSERGERQALLTVQRIDVMRVVVQVAERDVPLTEPGVPAQMTFDALPGMRFTGKVSRVGFVADPDTHSMRVEIDVPNPKAALRPGMSGTAALFLKKGSPRVLRLPLSSLVPVGEDGFAVYIVRDGKARRTPVEVGLRHGKEAEILSGLDPKDRVVTNPRELKGDAVPVRVKE
jgi:RND family efflux transporter MFP subunit